MVVGADLGLWVAEKLPARARKTDLELQYGTAANVRTDSPKSRGA
jgi:hypothetical protein